MGTAIVSSAQPKSDKIPFTQTSYATHASYLPPSLPQMLDIFSISSTAFKRVRNCSLFPGIPSDHGAVGINISLSSIKHIGERKVTRGVINWEKIGNDSVTRATFNARLYELNQESRAYNNLTYSVYFEKV